MKYVLAFLICCIPTVVELLNDANGDKKKLNDWISLGLISIVLAIVMHAWNKFNLPFWNTLPLMFGIHFLTFDYAIAYILYKRKIIEHPEAARWFRYLSDRGIDKIWKGWNPWVRFSVRVAVFIVTMFVFLS